MMPSVTYASRTSRLLGQFIDGCIAVAPLALFLLIPSDYPMGGVFLIVGWYGWVLFHVLLADSMDGGQSWGKRVAGTRVVDAISGAPCTLLQSFIRNILLSALGPIDWIFIFGERHQRLGDRAAGTIVIAAE
jgi:uncharacterized RDD family membrane protein YckC